MKASIGSILAAFLIVAALFNLEAAEDAPVSREQMAMLIEQLASRDEQVRTKAFRQIQHLGEACWPSMARYEKEDSERGKLVKLLGRECAIILHADQDHFMAARKKLENTKDPELRAEGFEDLMALGAAGIRFLEKHLSGANADLRYSLKPTTPARSGNGAITTQVLLENHGTGVAWCQANVFTPRTYISIREGYGQRRPGIYGTKGLGGGRKRIGADRPDYHPIKDWIPILPGDSISCKDCEIEIKGVGIHTLNAFGQVPEAAEIKARSKDSEAHCPFMIGAQLGETSRFILGKVDIYCLPSPENFPGVEEFLAIFASGKLEKQGDLDVIANVKVKLESKTKQEALLLEENLAKFAYFILLQEGKPIKWGSWHSVFKRKDNSEQDLAAKILRPGQGVEWELSIARPEGPGACRLLIVYEKPPTLEDQPELAKGFYRQLPFSIMTSIDDVFREE
ncbi:MAG: hypothetical protein M5U26_23695 [Planctomycetota bacterium]|nr:hypothetical protein [Planctomycetota bacterium]